jgi:hypothetical protein
MDWLVRRFGTEIAFDDARALRVKACEFAQMASGARDPVIVLELRRLAQEYERQAAILDGAGARPVPGGEEGPAGPGPAGRSGGEARERRTCTTRATPRQANDDDQEVVAAAPSAVRQRSSR